MYRKRKTEEEKKRKKEIVVINQACIIRNAGKYKSCAELSRKGEKDGWILNRVTQQARNE